MSRRETLNKLQEELRIRYKQLIHSMESDFESKISHNIHSNDVIDLASDSEGSETKMRTLAMGSNEALEISDTLKKCKEDTYGRCEDCEEEISIARLQAIPTASRCIKCQTKFEKRRF